MVQLVAPDPTWSSKLKENKLGKLNIPGEWEIGNIVFVILLQTTQSKKVVVPFLQPFLRCFFVSCLCTGGKICQHIQPEWKLTCQHDLIVRCKSKHISFIPSFPQEMPPLPRPLHSNPPPTLPMRCVFLRSSIASDCCPRPRTSPPPRRHWP